MFYRVFKPKYFPNGTSFDAKEKCGSYAKWRVGDGQLIKVFEDNWSPGHSSGKIIPVQPNLNRNLKVADLMTADKASWNEPLLDSFFLPHEAQQIKAIPLCVVPQSDSFYWSLEKSGTYFVKSGYKMLCEEARLEEASGSHRSGMTDLWSRIWKLKLPGKIIHFLWRACSDCLPTEVNLMKRKIVADPQCELCGSLPEDTKHALWGCEAVRRVWCMEFSWVNKRVTAYGSFLDLVELSLTKLGMGEVFRTMPWFIWTLRNEVRLREKTIPLSSVGEAAKHFLQQVRAVHEVQILAKKKPQKIKCFPPAETEFKANFDGAWFNESEEAGIGVVVRNSAGQVLVALAEKIKKPHNVDYLEMMAARREVIFAQEIGLQQCQFEGDSETIIKALKAGDMFSSSFGHLVIVNSFSSFSLSHIVRQGNAMAHALAERAYLSFPLLVWMEDVSSDIESTVLVDYQSS